MSELTTVAKKQKTLLVLLSLAAILFSVLTFFGFINYNGLYAVLGAKTTAILFIPAVLTLGTAVWSAILLLKNKLMGAIVPLATAVVACVLSFAFVSDAQLSSMTSHFLKYENQFNAVLTDARKKHEVVSSGTKQLLAGSEKLENSDLVPTDTLRVVVYGSNAAYLFVTLDSPDRLEGYVFLPDELYPDEWDEKGVEWSEALDISLKWYYVCIYK